MASLSFNLISRQEFERLALKEELPIYAYPFWLETAGGEGCFRYATLTKGNELVALCPLYHPLKEVWILPPCCQHGGLYFAKAYRSASLSPLLFKDRRQAMELLLEQQKSIRYAHISLSSDMLDALPFYWDGFSLKVRYNYMLDLKNEEDPFENKVNRLVRRKVKESESRQCKVIFDIPLETIAPFLHDFYKKRRIAPVFCKTILRCAAESIDRGNGLSAGLLSSSGEYLAVYFIALASGVGYSMATATKDDLPFANTALLYKTLIELRSRGIHTFDFEGSMLQGVEPVFRSLGGEQNLFIEMQKGSPSLFDRLRLRWHYQKLSKF